MDAVYRGLASPRQAIPIGRPDIEGSDRPGAALSGLAREALEEGAFPASEPAPVAPPAPQARHARPGPPEDAGHDGGHDDGHDLDPENEGHGPGEDGDLGLDEAHLDDGMDT